MESILTCLIIDFPILFNFMQVMNFMTRQQDFAYQNFQHLPWSASQTGTHYYMGTYMESPLRHQPSLGPPSAMKVSCSLYFL